MQIIYEISQLPQLACPTALNMVNPGKSAQRRNQGYPKQQKRKNSDTDRNPHYTATN